MKIRIEKLVADIGTLNTLNSKELPIKVSYALYKNIDKINKELSIYNREREKIINKYAIKDENGEILVDSDSTVKVAQEHIEDWNKAITELLELEVEIDVHEINLDELLNSNCNVSAGDIKQIEYMIKE